MFNADTNADSHSYHNTNCDTDGNGHAEYTDTNTDGNSGDADTNGDDNSGHPDPKSNGDPGNTDTKPERNGSSIPNGIAVGHTAVDPGDQPLDADASSGW